MLKLMLPQYHSTVSPKKYDIFRTGRSSASSGKSFFQIPARKKRYYVPLKALLGQNEGKDNILGILTEGCTHFRKYWITGIIQKHSGILEIFSLTFIKSLWDGLEIASFVGTRQSLNSKTICNFFSDQSHCCIFLSIFVYTLIFSESSIDCRLSESLQDSWALPRLSESLQEQSLA